MTVTLTIPDVDETVVERLRARADAHGTTLEDEVRAALASSSVREGPGRERPKTADARHPAAGPALPNNLADRLHSRFADLGGWNLPPQERPSARPLPFADWPEEDEATLGGR